MLYTRRVIDDETLPNTRAFIRSHSASLFTAIKSFISRPVIPQ